MLMSRKSPYISYLGIFIIYIYLSLFLSIPSNITVIKGEEYNPKFSNFISLNETDALQSEEVNNIIKLKANLFGKIPIKTVNLKAVNNISLIPVGTTIGVKINTTGITVLTFEEFNNLSGESVRPYKNVNIMRGDIITHINGEAISSVEDFIIKTQKNGDKESTLKLMRNSEEIYVKIFPQIDKEDNNYKFGIWVKETTTGIGTVTFIDPESKKFAALGHGINDINGNSLLRVRDGNAYVSYILTAIKGRKGSPGELKGAIREGDSFGKITKNTVFGIYGELNKDSNIIGDAVEVGLNNEVKIGDAEIICNIDGDKVERFKIKIEKINRQSLTGPKNMVIRVIDRKLIEKTGGIVQGMSGSPIIQNEKLVGAVTHVLINDPTCGYGIFIENMIEEIKK